MPCVLFNLFIAYFDVSEREHFSYGRLNQKKVYREMN